MKEKWTPRFLLYEFISLFFSAWLGVGFVFGLLLLSLLTTWIVNTTWAMVTVMCSVTIVLYASGKLRPKD